MNFLKIKLLVIAVVMFAASSAFASYSYTIDVNTSSLVGQTGYIDILLSPFNTTNVATATTANFAADAAFAFNGDPVSTGNVSGQLSDNTLSANTAGSSIYNDYFQQVTFGNTLHFQLNLAGDPGNRFTLAFYAADGATSLLSTDSISGAAVTIDLGAAPVVTSNETSVTPTPIPGAVYLLGSGLMGLVGLRRRKQE